MVYDYKEACEAKEGQEFTVVIAHHSFLIPWSVAMWLSAASRRARRVSALLRRAWHSPQIVPLGDWRKEHDRVPIRFYKQITNERLFSDQETGMNACFVICEKQKHGIAEIIPCFPQNRVVGSPSGIDPDVFKKSKEISRRRCLRLQTWRSIEVRHVRRQGRRADAAGSVAARHVQLREG